jgi:hypothetical protein
MPCRTIFHEVAIWYALPVLACRKKLWKSLLEICLSLLYSMVFFNNPKDSDRSCSTNSRSHHRLVPLFWLCLSQAAKVASREKTIWTSMTFTCTENRVSPKEVGAWDARLPLKCPRNRCRARASCPMKSSSFCYGDPSLSEMFLVYHCIVYERIISFCWMVSRMLGWKTTAQPSTSASNDN